MLSITFYRVFSVLFVFVMLVYEDVLTDQK